MKREERDAEEWRGMTFLFFSFQAENKGRGGEGVHDFSPLHPSFYIYSTITGSISLATPT